MTPGDEDRREPEIEIRLPETTEALSQDEEWYEAVIDGEVRRIGFHEYAETYALPGIYERLFYDVLRCDSPRTVCELLEEQLEHDDRRPDDLRALDVGAGNGIVGEHLRTLGADQVVGVDIIAEAAEAAARDRGDVYDDYHVVDLTAMPAETREDLVARRFNCMTSVAALGFDDIPPQAFAEAYNVIEPGGLVGFSIKEEMVSGEDSSGFSRLIEDSIASGALEVRRRHRYRHRLNTSGEALYYVAMIAAKGGDMSVAG